MFSNPGSRVLQPGILREFRAADNAAQLEGAPLCFDQTEISGGTTSQDMTVHDDEAVSSFIATPDSVLNNNANMIGCAGVVEEAYAKGEWHPHICGGSVKVRLKNTTAASMTYAVGQALVLEPGQDYFTPVYSNLAAGGTTKVASKGGACVRAFVTVAKTIAAGAVDLAQAYLFMPGAPAPFCLPFGFGPAADVPADFPVCVTNGPGIITRAGLGAAINGVAGTLTLDVLINGVSIFTTQPVIAFDAAEPCHTLTIVDTAVGTYLGTGGSFGLIDPTKAAFAAGAVISATAVNGSSYTGTGINIQIDGLYY